MNNDNNKFNYTYAAPTEQERREIDSIRRQYTSEQNVADKLEQLRQLDAKVKTAPKIVGLVLGIIGILVFGFGLTMVLEWAVVIWGVVVMAVGIVPMATAYPVYQRLLKRNKNKYGQMILDISDELLSGHSDEEKPS